MMDIDIQRLKTDAAYWDEVDVTKGKATHYCTQGGGFCTPDYIRYCDIPRPAKPAAPEWDGETFIQAGHRLQARVNDNPWLSGEITYRSDSGVVFRPDDGGDELFWRFALFDVEFLPIRTKEQRERDELVKKACEVITSGYSFYIGAEELANKLYDAGLLQNQECD